MNDIKAKSEVVQWQMETLNAKKVIIILIIVLCLVVASAIAVYFLTKDDEVSFEANDKRFFRNIASLDKSTELEIKSVDAYFLKDKNHPLGGIYYYNFKYDLYITALGEWDSINKVIYGPYATYTDMFCFNWTDAELERFENEIKEFEKAKKEGVHNTYTDEEIEKLMEEAFEWLKENE